MLLSSPWIMKIKMTDTINVGKNVLHHGSDTAGPCVSGRAVLGDCELAAVQVNRNYTSATRIFFFCHHSVRKCAVPCHLTNKHLTSIFLCRPLHSRKQL